MPTYIYMDNYRGFSQTWVPLTQVNFLVGENSTGKTSFLELLQTLTNPGFWLFEPKFNQPGAPTKHFEDLVSASSSSRENFTIGAIETQSETNRPCKGILVTYQNHEGRATPRRISVIDDQVIRTVDGALWTNHREQKYWARTKQCRGNKNQKEGNPKIFSQAHKENKNFQEKTISQEQEGLPIFLRFAELYTTSYEDYSKKIPSFFRKGFSNLAPIRSQPKRTYDAPQTEFSPEGDHIPYIIRKQLSNKIGAVHFSKFLKLFGKESGLFDSVTIKDYGADERAPFEIQIKLGKSALSLNNVGYGVSQSLPIAVEIFIRPERTLFAIQQPEVHLHPKAQASIGDLIAELARAEEKIFFVETHSDFTIDRFRLNLRKSSEIPSQLLFFERKSSENKVEPIKIDGNGNLPEDQPKNYRAFFFNESLSILE